MTKEPKTIEFMGGYITLRFEDSSFVSKEGKTIPLKRGIQVQNNGRKANLSKAAIVALLQLFSNDDEAIALLDSL